MSQYHTQQFVSAKALFGINKGHVQLALAVIARAIEQTMKIATYRWIQQIAIFRPKHQTICQPE